MALYHAHHKVLSRSTRNTVAALAYRSGTSLVNSQTGEVSDYTKKNVNHVEILLPTDAPIWAKDIVELVKEDKETGLQKLSDVVESAEKRLDAQIYREFEMALPRELSDGYNIALANEFVQDQLCGRGMLAIQNFHFDVDEKTGEKKPHCHTLLLTRRLTDEGLSPLKERAWNSKELHNDLREKWAEYVNFHLKMHGFEMRVDHRSYGTRGIDLEAQPKMGKGALEVARKLGTRPLENGLAPEAEVAQVVPLVAWRRAAFLDVKVRNAYRLLANPKIVLEAVSSTQSVFGVKDLEKVIGRYTDDVALKDRLLAKVLSSSEVVVLGAGKEAADPLRQGKEGLKETSLREDRLLLTTASLLKAELSLVERAKDLGQRAWQAEVSKILTSETPKGEAPTSGVETVMKAFEAREGFGLSEEQRAAVNHMVSGGQLSCIVGYAGAGKTTALKVAKEVFESSGYAVVGLAPTGRAAQNLQDSGIASQTLHRFLRSFEGGRNQLKAHTVLVLDEAGMVDVKLFEGFLSAVEKLGVKAIVVGDGAQLQAVGAGDAFRLVTKALDPMVMADVRRQTLDWQREVTKAFGRLETREALQAYVNKGHVTFVEEKVPTLEKLVEAQDVKGIVDLYTLSCRMEKRHLMAGHEVMNHNEKLSEWKEVKLACATHMASNLDVFRSHMEKGRVDPLGFASHFVTRHDVTGQPVTRHGSEGKTPAEREFEAAEIAKRWCLPALARDKITDGKATSGREATKAAMVAAWKASVKTHPTSSHLMLAYANKDVADLNRLARAAMKEAGVIRGPEFTYATSKTSHPMTSGGLRGEQETAQKSFAVGDRLMFGKNDRGLDVKNGMIGTVESLSASKIVVRLDGADSPSASERRVSFSPKLYPFFDHGFAVTTHKAQGVTVDRVFKLASFEEYRNLAYVGMTRHREDVRVFGSTLDFWNKEIFLDRLSAENNKLALMDMAPEHVLREKLEALPSSLTKTFERMGNHLEAMGFVAKHLYQKTVKTFLQSKDVVPDLVDLPSVAMTDAVKADVKEQETGRDIFHSPEALTLIKAAETAGIHDPKAFALRGLEGQKILSERGEAFSSAHLQTLIQRVGYEERKWEEIHAITKDDFMRRLDVDHLSPLHLLALEKETQKMAALESRIFAEHAAQNKPLTDSEIFIEAMGQMKALAAEQKILEKSLSEHHTPFVAKMVSEEIVCLKATHGEGPSALKVQQCIHIVQEVEKKHANHVHLEETSMGVEKTLSQKDHDRAEYTKAFEAREGLKALSMGKTQISETERQKRQEAASLQFERQEKILENERQQQSKELVLTR